MNNDVVKNAANTIWPYIKINVFIIRWQFPPLFSGWELTMLPTNNSLNHLPQPLQLTSHNISLNLIQYLLII